MTNDHEHSSLLRVRGERRERVAFMELFFDLVYVFAITQLSHLLLEHLSVRGALQTLLLLLAVWWAWIYTAWITNWFDPDHRTVRAMLVGVMLGSLIMAASLPEAFGDRGLAFAGAYVATQIGRSLFAVAALGGEPPLRRNFQRILVWATVSGALWLAGGLADGSAREGLWLAAVAVEYTGPVAGFFTPGLGRSTTRDWTIAGGHLAERCELFLIVALGESILVTGTMFSALDASPSVVAAFVVAFLGSVALWWVYFALHAEVADEVIASSTDPGRLGRSAYTYFHLPMVAGIIVTAVGDELSIAHPTGHADTATVATVLGGPALFLAGHLLFKRAAFGRLSASRPTALVALGVLALVGSEASPLLLAVASTLIVAAVAAWDIWSLRRAAAPVRADATAP